MKICTPSLQIQAKAITDSNKIFNIFNIYFCTIGEETQSKLNRFHQKYTDHFVSNTTTPTLFMSSMCANKE